MSNTEYIVARGHLFELVELPQPDGRTFELARRAPGVRVIIPDRDAGRLLLTKEYRRELSGYDYRLPGGKVFDSLQEYEAFLSSGKDIEVPASTKAIAESAEEAGIDVEGVKLFKISRLGATVQWDLFVFEATGWTKRQGGQALEAGEVVDEVAWVDYDNVKAKILKGEMQEERIALILLQWLEAIGSHK
jgi:ADP-ribose pyrophosphatase